MRPKSESPARIMNPVTAAQRALLYEAALREMEQHRDEVIAACATLRRMLTNEQKIAALERGEKPPSVDAGDPVDGIGD